MLSRSTGSRICRRPSPKMHGETLISGTGTVSLPGYWTFWLQVLKGCCWTVHKCCYDRGQSRTEVDAQV